MVPDNILYGTRQYIQNGTLSVTYKREDNLSLTINQTK